MWDKVLTGVKQSFWFFARGSAPKKSTGTSRKVMEQTNHFVSLQFTICFLCIFILIVLFLISTGFLFFLPGAEAITAFTLLFKETIQIIGLVVSILIGAKGLVSLKYGSSSNISMANESRQEDIEKRILGNAKDDDYNINLDIDETHEYKRRK